MPHFGVQSTLRTELGMATTLSYLAMGEHYPLEHLCIWHEQWPTSGFRHNAVAARLITFIGQTYLAPLAGGRYQRLTQRTDARGSRL